MLRSLTSLIITIFSVLIFTACSNSATPNPATPEPDPTPSLGEQWEILSTNTTEPLNGLTSDGTTIVAVGGANGTHPRIIYTTSSNLNSWTAVTNYTGTPANINLNSVASSGSMFMAVGDGGQYLTSIDGINWTYQTPLSVNLTKIIYTDTKFVAVGVANICSGSTTLTCTSYTGTFNDITWNGSAYVAVGDAGLIHTSTSGAHNSFGTALNTGISGVGTENIKAITTDGTIFFLVTDNITMKVFESENNSGQTWNNIVDQNFNSTGIAFMDTMLFGISTAGDVRRTSDFATTQTYNIGITQDLYSIIRINNSLFVTGNNGTVAQSILN